MSTDLLTSTEFYILNQSFEKIFAFTQYESLMWVDKYDEPGTFEVYAPPLPEIMEAAQIGNYFMSTKSEHLMIIEKLVTSFNVTDGERLVISGRSLESILDRRVVFTSTYFHQKGDSEDDGADNLEDAVRQIIDWAFIRPEDNDRKVSNFIFEYTHDDGISDINLEDKVFDKGTNLLEIVTTLVKSRNLGYKITLDSQNNFVFKLIKGKDLTSEQTVNPLVQFSPVFNNLKDSKFTVDGGEAYKNFIFTEGETYQSQAPKIIKTGDATGLERREYYVESDVTHTAETTNLKYNQTTEKWYFEKEKKTLTEDEYQEALDEAAKKTYNTYSQKTTLESEIEPRLQFTYGKDFNIGDIVEIADRAGNKAKSRVIEFIISHSTSGYEEYPTFEDVEDTDEDPDQTYTSGGEYTDGKESGGGGGTDLDSLSTSTNDMADNDLVVSKENGATDWVKKSASKVWDYIKGKIGISTTGSAYLRKDGTWSDTSDMTETFTSSDTTDGNATSWTSVSKLTSGESHSSIFAKISKMFKNIRYLYKMLGTTDISSIGNGSVTGAISSLNTNKIGGFKIKSIGVTHSISNGVVGEKSTNIAESGWTPLGVVGIRDYAWSHIFVAGYYIEGNTLYTKVRRANNDAATGNYTYNFYVLYYKF